MSTAPVVTIFVRHSVDCKYRGEGFEKRCRCRKHFRWTHNGEQQFRKAGTRSWEEAEAGKRRLEDQLSGRAPAQDDPKSNRLTVENGVQLFMDAKRNDGLEPPSLAKLQKSVDRVLEFATADHILFLDEINLTHVTTWPWSKFFKTTHALRNNQSRVKSFFRYFEIAGKLQSNPAKAWKAVKGKTEQACGFTPQEFKAVLKAVDACGFQERTAQKMHALVLLMRYTGLALIDACCLERGQLHVVNGVYRVRLKSRQKTSKKTNLQPIDNALPKAVGEELVKVLNGNPRYVFWDYAGEGPASDEQKRNASERYFQKFMRTLLDKAGLPNATSHKFRHTLAIEMVRHGASFEDVAAALGNTVAVVAKFYSHEWAKVRQSKTDKALKATW